MNKRFLYILALLGITLLGGCIVTGTFVTTVRLAPDDLGNSITISDSDFDGSELEINLAGDATFEDHKDQIKDIDNVGFYLDITNTGDSAITFQLFLEKNINADWDDTSIDFIVDSSTQVYLTGLNIPAGANKIVTWNESFNYVTGFSTIKKIVEDGVFSLYPLAFNTASGSRTNFEMTINSMVVIVTFTAGK